MHYACKTQWEAVSCYTNVIKGEALTGMAEQHSEWQAVVVIDIWCTSIIKYNSIVPVITNRWGKTAKSDDFYSTRHWREANIQSAFQLWISCSVLTFRGCRANKVHATVWLVKHAIFKYFSYPRPSCLSYQTPAMCFFFYWKCFSKSCCIRQGSAYSTCWCLIATDQRFHSSDLQNTSKGKRKKIIQRDKNQWNSVSIF